MNNTDSFWNFHGYLHLRPKFNSPDAIKMAALNQTRCSVARKHV